ncbi:LysR family transcriptional regulator [Cupriavidus basilensis]|uniref:LysR family transcriptional regulator n=1 Tax=Cupriavidus basilensis TaxID=68895 RepID=A0ABT6ANL7_9BURK|nr:LysR family transcriptional regulator [Cupriavidus basilensis]MDF3834216.1 LysR family transcriptional regulator [Cupriavidus basilensis]
MNITLRQLQVFLALFESRSFTATAARMHVTQSAVSKMVAELELQLGFALFDRTSRRVEPNDAAREFRGFAEDIMASMQAATRSVVELSDLTRGQISIAASPLMIYGLLAEPIARYRERYPGIRFDLHELSTDDTVESVRSGQVDFGFGSLDSEVPGVEEELVFRDRLVAVAPQGHPIAGRKSVKWADLAQWQHVSLRRVYSVRRTLDHVLKKEGIALPSQIEAGTLTVALGLARAGAGIVVLPGYAADIASEWGMAAVEIDSRAQQIHRISLIRRKSARLSVAARSFLAELLPVLRAREPAMRKTRRSAKP